MLRRRHAAMDAFAESLDLRRRHRGFTVRAAGSFAVVVLVGGWFALMPAAALYADTERIDEDGPRLAATVIDEDVYSRDLSSLERQQALAKAREEVKWWHDILAPADEDELYAYMERMLHSLRFFYEHGLSTHLYTAIEQQRALREGDAAFCVLAGLVHGYGPTLEGRNQALEDVRRALRLNPRFAFARFADGLVRILREQARLTRGMPLRPAQVRIALANLERAVEAQPDLAEAHRFLALGHAMLSDFEAALVAADKALGGEPERLAMWRVCVAVLREHKPGRIVEAIEQRLVEHGKRLPAGMRLYVYGMLADEYTRRGQHGAAFDLLVMQALPVAHEHPETLRASQWRRLYAESARAAARKQPGKLDLAYGFLEAATRHSQVQRLRLYPLVEPHQEVLARLLAESDDGDGNNHRVTVETFGGAYLTLLCEAISRDALTERETARVVDGLSWFLRASPVSPDELELERSTLWTLVRWLFVKHRRSDDATYFELGMTVLDGLLPVEAEQEYRVYSEATLEGAAQVELREVQHTLIEHGITARQAHTRTVSAHMLARLMRSTSGERRMHFVTSAERTLNSQRVNDAALDQMVAVCEVLRLYPLEQLREPLLAAMARVHASGNTAHCRRLFEAAHAALNVLAVERHEPEWLPNGETPLAEYGRLLEQWQRRSHVDAR